MKKVSIYNSFVKDNPAKREQLANKLRKKGFQTSREGDLLIVIGGDGTFLNAIRKRRNNDPIFVGINTGNLGFLSEFDFDQINHFIKTIKRREYWIEELPVYEVTLRTKNGEIKDYFVNDLSVERTDTGVLHMDIHTNGSKLCSVYGDGVIVSSQVGSTAYSLSANGPIMLDNDSSILMTPSNPIWNKEYHSLMKSVLMNANSELIIYPNAQKIRSFRVVTDGKEVKTEEDVRFVTVKRSTKVIKILRSNDFSRKENIKKKILEQE